MRFSEILGSWTAIIGVPMACVAAKYAGMNELTLTFIMSIAALTFTQIVIREQNKDAKIDKEIQEEQLRVEREIKQKVT